jgi:GntR family transcriptional regulator/MocR family aminotransferase
VLRSNLPFDDVAACGEAAAEGVPVRPLSRYFVSRAAEGGVVFGFGAISARAVRPSIQQLASILARHGA